MTVNIESPRFAVEYRPRGVRKWSTVVVVGSAEVATKTMYDLMATRVGDWGIRQLPAGPVVESGR